MQVLSYRAWNPRWRHPTFAFDVDATRIDGRATQRKTWPDPAVISACFSEHADSLVAEMRV